MNRELSGCWLCLEYSLTMTRRPCSKKWVHMSINLYKNVDSSYTQSGNIPSSHQQKNRFKKKVLYSCYGTLKAMKRNKPRIDAAYAWIQKKKKKKKPKLNLKKYLLEVRTVATSVGSVTGRKRTQWNFMKWWKHFASCSRWWSHGCICEWGT